MNKVTQFCLALLFLVALFAVGLWYFPVIKANEKLRERELALVEQINKQRLENRKLLGRIIAIKTDRRVVESLARERLHYARPDELVILFTSERRAGYSLPSLFSRQ